MNKTRCRVVSNTTPVKGEGRIPKIGGPDTWQSDINRHGLHVQAVRSYSQTMRPQELVAPGRTIPADYVDFSVGPAQLSREIVQQIKDPGVIVVDVAGAVVAQVTIKLIERFGEVTVTLAIDNIQAFPGMQVE